MQVTVMSHEVAASSSTVISKYKNKKRLHHEVSVKPLSLCDMVKMLLLLLLPFNGLFSRTTWVSRHKKRELFWILMKQEMIGGSDISRTICRSSAPCCRLITMPAPHHSYFL